MSNDYAFKLPLGTADVDSFQHTYFLSVIFAFQDANNWTIKYSNLVTDVVTELKAHLDAKLRPIDNA
jgi:hypothetical protein